MARTFRLGPEGSNIEFSITPAVKGLLFANTLIFVVFSFLPTAMLWLGLTPALFVRGAIWQLLTYQFMHVDLSHIFFNMLALWMFGTAVEGVWGQRRFLTYYFTCGVGAGLSVVLVAYLFGGVAEQHVPTVGASGAIFGILLAFGIMFPNSPIWMFFLFRVPAKVAVLIFGAIELFGFTHSSGGTVSHLAHLGGLLTGYLYMRFAGFTGSSLGYGYRQPTDFSWLSPARWRYAYEEWNRRRLRKKFQVYMKKRGGDDGTIH